MLEINFVTFVCWCLFYCTRCLCVSARGDRFKIIPFPIAPITEHLSAMVWNLVYHRVGAVSAIYWSHLFVDSNPIYSNDWGNFDYGDLRNRRNKRLEWHPGRLLKHCGTTTSKTNTAGSAISHLQIEKARLRCNSGAFYFRIDRYN